MKILKVNLNIIIVARWDTQKTFVGEILVRKMLNLSLLITILIVRNNDTKHTSVGKRQVKYLLHLYLKDISLSVKIRHKD